MTRREFSLNPEAGVQNRSAGRLVGAAIFLVGAMAVALPRHLLAHTEVKRESEDLTALKRDVLVCQEQIRDPQTEIQRAQGDLISLRARR